MQQLLELAQEAEIFAEKLVKVQHQIAQFRRTIEEHSRHWSVTQRSPSEGSCSDAATAPRLPEHDKESDADSASFASTATPTIELRTVSCDPKNLTNYEYWARIQALTQHVQRMHQLVQRMPQLVRLGDNRLTESLRLDDAIIELKLLVESLDPGPTAISIRCYMIRLGKGAALQRTYILGR